jgi:hypothetical protein
MVDVHDRADATFGRLGRALTESVALAAELARVEAEIVNRRRRDGR